MNSPTLSLNNLPELQDKPTQQSFINNPLELLQDMPIECDIRIGHCSLTFKELQKLSQGTLIELPKQLTEPVDILIEQTVIAQGVLMHQDGWIGIRITDVFFTKD